MYSSSAGLDLPIGIEGHWLRANGYLWPTEMSAVGISRERERENVLSHVGWSVLLLARRN